MAELSRYVWFNPETYRYRISGSGTPGGCTQREYTRQQLPEWAKQWLNWQDRNETSAEGDPVYTKSSTKSQYNDAYGPLAGCGFTGNHSTMARHRGLTLPLWAWDLVYLAPEKFERAVSALLAASCKGAERPIRGRVRRATKELREGGTGGRNSGTRA